MSRSLPPHPNLEHLKKQAKERLRALQLHDPALKLSDAQHALAREYGFASWPKLKAHVEALSTASHPAGVAAKAHPLVGTWRANLAKSKQHPANPFQSATLQFDVIGDAVTITDRVVDASGHEEQRQNNLLADGQEHPAESRNGYVVMARWQGANALEALVKKDGQVEGRVTYAFSPNGQTLTLSTDEQVIVLDRQ